MKASVLGQSVIGRVNNLNLLRLVAALAVLVSHSSALVSGNSQNEPFRASLGVSIGEVAVQIFFFLSGFLVFGSLLRQPGWLEFFVARLVRIYPGLLAMLIIVVFIIGPACSELDITSYFLSSAWARYLFYCSTLVFGLAYELPGVFVGNPWPLAVNGSLWSLQFEIIMYLLLLVMALGAQFASRCASKLTLGRLAMIVATVFHVVLIYHQVGRSDLPHFWQLGAYFFQGAVYYLARDHVRFNNWSLLALTLWVVAVIFFPPFYRLTAPWVLGYFLLFLAYTHSGRFFAFNSVGDYSYGVYIYAYPLQQLIIYLMPRLSVDLLNIVAISVVLPCAMASWHFVEKPSIIQRGAVVAWLRGYIQRLWPRGTSRNLPPHP